LRFLVALLLLNLPAHISAGCAVQAARQVLQAEYFVKWVRPLHRVMMHSQV